MIAGHAIRGRLAVVLLMALLGLGVNASAPWAYDQLIDPVDPIQFPLFDQIGSRAAALDVRRDSPVGSSRPLGLVMGPSSVRWGLRSKALEAADPSDREWFVFGGQGRSFAKLSFYARPVIAAVRRGDVVLVGIHPFHAAGEPAEGIEGVRDLFVAPHAGRVGSAITRNAYLVREALMRAVGQRLSAWFPPAESAYDLDPTGAERATRQAPAQPAGSPYWGEASAYDPSQDESVYLLRTLRAFGEAGARVFLVLMPERLSVRQETPAKALASLQWVLDEARRSAPLVVMDFRDALPDEEFVALTHLRPEAAEKFSALLAEKLTELLATDPELPSN